MRRGAVYFAAWARWAPRKRRLRRTKVRVKDKVNEWACSNGIRTWMRKVHDARVLYAFQLARGLTLQPSPQYERAVPSTIRVCKEDKEPEPYEFDASDADAVARRRHLSAYSAGLLLLNRGPLWYTVKCFTEWRRVVKATVRWRRQRFLYLHSMAKQLQRTVLLAWQGVAKGAAVPCLLPNGSRLSLDPLKPLDRFADTCHKVFVENCQAELLVEDRAMALSFGGGGIDDCHECPVEGIDDDDFFIEDLERRRRALAEHGDVVQSEKLRTAADEGELDAVKSALRSGASVDSRDELGRTALHLASSHLASRYVDVVATLLHCGADAGALDDNKKIPIDAATNPHIAKLLVAHRSRLQSRAYTRKERRQYLELRIRELEQSVSFWCLWKCCIYRGLGLLAGRLERPASKPKPR